MKRPSRATLGYLLLGAIAVFFATQFLSRDEKPEDLTLTEFNDRLEADEVKTATMKDKSHKVTGELEDGTEYSVSFPAEFGDELTQEIADADPPVDLDVDGRLGVGDLLRELVAELLGERHRVLGAVLHLAGDLVRLVLDGGRLDLVGIELVVELGEGELLRLLVAGEELHREEDGDRSDEQVAEGGAGRSLHASRRLPVGLWPRNSASYPSPSKTHT